MMHEEKISVIIPVYCVEKYVARCIESVLQQTYSNLEILLIDDGSPDQSGKICDDYQKQDARIRVIHQENSGVSAARNRGLDEATGEYITFLDADDWYDERYCEIMLRLLKDNKTKLAMCQFQRVFQENTFSVTYDQNIVVRTKNDAMAYLVTNENVNYLWGKMYQKDIFEGIRLPIGRIFSEDTAIMFRLFDRCEKVAFTDAQMYAYYDNPGSVSGKATTQKLYDVLLAWTEQFEFCAEKYPKLKRSCLKQMAHYYLLIHSYAKAIDDVYRLKARKRVLKYCRKMFLATDLKHKVKFVIVSIKPGFFMK